MADKVKFDPKKVQRNKCLAWDAKANQGKGAGVYTGDLLNDDGTVNTDKARAFGVDPAAVVYLTPSDIPTKYLHDGKLTAKSALQAYTADGNYATADDAILDLIVASVMQDLANASVKAHRPVTDKAVSRATSTLRKVLAAQGKTDAEIDAVLAALNTK